MTVSTVRLLIADPEVYARALFAGDGVTKEFGLPQSPVVANSQVVSVAGVAKVEGVDYTFLDEPGVLTFTVAPPVPPDPDAPNGVVTFRHSLLSDASLAALLTLEGDNDKLAAAAALDIMASSEALILKKIELLDLKTDGPAVAKALREHAKTLRDQVADVLAIADANAWDWAEIVVDEFSARERRNAEAIRSW